MTIRRRIALAMAVVLASAALSAAVSWSLTAQANRVSAQAVQASRRAAWAADLRTQLREYMSAAGDVVIGLRSGESAEVSAEYGNLLGVDDRLRRTLRSGGAPLGADKAAKVRSEWDVVRAGIAEWINSESSDAERALRLAVSADRLSATTSSGLATPPALAGLSPAEKRRQVHVWAEALIDGTLRRAARSADQSARAAQAAAEDARRTALFATLGLLFVNFLVALATGVWLYRTIATPLKEAQQVASRVAEGDLDATFPLPSTDEVGVMLGAVEQMRDAVVGKISAMREVAGAVLITSESLHSMIQTASQLPEGDPGIEETLQQMDGSSKLLHDMALQMVSE